jgi:hypothetical protein
MSGDYIYDLSNGTYEEANHVTRDGGWSNEEIGSVFAKNARDTKMSNIIFKYGQQPEPEIQSQQSPISESLGFLLN